MGKLAASLDFMKDSLKQYIKDLKETTAAKERIESELKIARDIQMGMLPKRFPPFPQRPELGIYAMIESAREVGGDLYDFFFLDEDHLCIAIGDVSGKGVPAALFKAIAMTLLKTKAKEDMSPSSVLTRVNHDLSQDNPYSMFVTLFLGILNVRTGEFTYCNGGHNPPWLFHPPGDVLSLQGSGGTALGALEDVFYLRQETTLQKGDTLFLYTDGVTVAMNEKGELFGDERLQKVLSTLKGSPVETVVEGVMSEVKGFSRGAPQSDDIAMMAVRFHGPHPIPLP